ncbi:MAG: hypothetical protein GTN38_01210 [Candidatus Aenigmarchaeota archaeon]|nr:hypothetical protein [Candidatus Aenigmarchaeota archaeon]NIQ17746.1 hypothetical protein [Candidatus Aenigmarchaeota archaeon]NIS73066.1 hypothetical protein [Candidatus Aenigmarchaeota archaeon]
MKEAVLLIIFILVFTAFLAYKNLPETGFPGENSIKPPESETHLTLNLSSNKEVYHSSEEVELKTTIETPAKLENLTIKVYGIKDRSGRFRIDGERMVDVEPPGTSETFAFRMPSCYGCAGVSPGEYEIMFEIIKDGNTIGNFSKTIRLEG